MWVCVGVLSYFVSTGTVCMCWSMDDHQQPPLEPLRQAKTRNGEAWVWASFCGMISTK